MSGPISSITSTINKVGKYIGDYIDGWDTKHQSRLRVRESLRIAKEIHSQRHNHHHRSTKVIRLLTVLQSVIALRSEGAYGDGIHDNVVKFDTDSSFIGIDNRASACISWCEKDFVGPLIPVPVQVQGFAGHRTSNVMMGTLRWQWLDDEGMKHTFHIPRSYYVKEGKIRLLSPQHWAKTQKDHVDDGTGESTNDKRVVLYWNGKQNTLTIPLRKRDNVANIHMPPGYENFTKYCSQAKIDYAKEQFNPIICHDVGIVSDDEDDDDEVP